MNGRLGRNGVHALFNGLGINGSSVRPSTNVTSYVTTSGTVIAPLVGITLLAGTSMVRSSMIVAALPTSITVIGAVPMKFSLTSN